MKVVIAGGRNYENYCEAKAFIDECIRKSDNVVILSGCCSGADRLGERYAVENGYKIERYPALWKKYGKRAGVMRNAEMAEAADLVICFWNGKSKGTKSMIELSKARGKTVMVKYVMTDE